MQLCITLSNLYQHYMCELILTLQPGVAVVKRIPMGDRGEKLVVEQAITTTGRHVTLLQSFSERKTVLKFGWLYGSKLFRVTRNHFQFSVFFKIVSECSTWTTLSCNGDFSGKYIQKHFLIVFVHF